MFGLTALIHAEVLIVDIPVKAVLFLKHLKNSLVVVVSYAFLLYII